MAIYYARFSEATGDFKGQTITSHIDGGMPSKEGVIYKALQNRLANGKNYMLDGAGDIVEKNDFDLFDKLTITADGVDEATLSNLPLGAHAHVGCPTGEFEGNIVEEDEGTLIVSCDMPGKIIVTLQAVNYKTTEVEITAS